jgi:hypothetical protein
VVDRIILADPDDDLSAFHSEADAPAASILHTPAARAVDALDDMFVSERPATHASRAALAPPPQVQDASPLRRATPFVVRWVAPSAAALLVGALGAGATLSFFGSHPMSPDRAREETRTVTPTSNVSATPTPPAAPRAQLPRPPIFSGLEASALDNVPRVAVQRLLPPPMPAAPPGSETRQRITASSQPVPERRIAPQERRPRSAPGRAVTSPASLSAPPLAPLTIDTARGRDLGLLALAESPRPVHLTAATPVGAPSAEEHGVRRALLSYETAYEDLDVAAAVAVWPTVDRDRLSRAFATLKSQALEFQSCAIKMETASATAYCRGTLEYVRKVGNPAPLQAQQQWTFKMRRADAGWKIDEVSASQAPVLAAQRTRGQG